MEHDIGLWAIPIAILGGAIRVSTPFLFVSLGEVLTERSGRINLGLEGTLVFGAMAGYAIAVMTGSAWAGVVVAAVAGSLFGLLHGLRSFVPVVAACPGCGRTTSTVFQELARDIQDMIRDRMPDWKTQYPGVETLNFAVMGCIVNGPGESKHADVGISLPGTGESPAVWMTFLTAPSSAAFCAAASTCARSETSVTR